MSDPVPPNAEAQPDAGAANEAPPADNEAAKNDNKANEEAKKKEDAKKAEEEKKANDDKKADDTAPLFSNPLDTPDDLDKYKPKENAPLYTNCCCCICHCSDELTENEVCCLLIPLKAGITFIAIITIILIALQISQQFFLMLNDQVKWWYPFVNVVLYAPTYTGASFFVVWLGKDDISNRGRLACGCILVVISTSLVAAWAIIYFVWIYKQEYVYYGWGTPESGYLKFQKKYYIFRELLTAIIILTLYSYFICVTSRYCELLREERSDIDKADWADEKAARKEAEEWLAKERSEGRRDP